MFGIVAAASLVAMRASADEILKIKAGEMYEVKTKSTLTGSLEFTDPKDKQTRRLAINGTAVVQYVERVIPTGKDSSLDRTLRVYKLVNYQRKVGDQPQKAGMPGEPRIVFQRRDNVEVPYSPDGPLQWLEIDLLRTHEFVPLLDGFLPDGDVKPGAVWDAAPSATAELLGLEPVESGRLTCTYNGVQQFGDKKLGQIEFGGVIFGRTKEEGRCRNEVSGAVYIDPATHRMASIRTIGTRQILGDNNKVIGKLEVDHGMILQFLPDDPELAAPIEPPLPDQPTAALTRLVYENPILGARLLHPRRWFLESVQGNQMLLRDWNEQRPTANTIVIHCEQDGKTPTAAAYREEVLKYLKSTKVDAVPQGEPRETRSAAGRIGNFQLSAVLDGRPMILDYWVVERGKRGVTIASRIASDDARLLEDVKSIAYSVEFFDSAKPIGPPTRTQTPSGK